jgi:hypothetical protein
MTKIFGSLTMTHPISNNGKANILSKVCPYLLIKHYAKKCTEKTFQEIFL